MTVHLAQSRAPIGAGIAPAHAAYARAPQAANPSRNTLHCHALTAPDSAPGAAMGTALGATATPKPLHRLKPLLLARTGMAPGHHKQTCPALAARSCYRSATPGRGCHRPPRPTFSVAVQEHLNRPKTITKSTFQPPHLSALDGNRTLPGQERGVQCWLLKCLTRVT